jgi:hypothetical protein
MKINVRNILILSALMLDVTISCFPQAKNSMTVGLKELYPYEEAVEIQEQQNAKVGKHKVPPHYKSRFEIPLCVDVDLRDLSKVASAYIEVTVNDIPMQFIFDTGAPESVVTDDFLIELGISIPHNNDNACYGLIIKECSLGGKNFRNNQIFLYYDGYARLDRIVDVNHNRYYGVIGMSLFRTLVNTVCVDCPEKKVIINDRPSEYKKLQKTDFSYDTENNDFRIFCPISINDKKCMAVIDSGGISEVVDNRYIQTEASHTKAMDMSNSPSQLVAGKLDSIVIGNTLLENKEAYLADEYIIENDDVFHFAFKRGSAILGLNGFFDCCKVWISFKDNWVRVKKVK